MTDSSDDQFPRDDDGADGDIIGREGRTLPEPAALDDLKPLLVPTEATPVPHLLFLDGAGPNERTLLWDELQSIIDKVNGAGINTLTPYEFALYHLLLPLFKSGTVIPQTVNRMMQRKFGPDDEVIATFNAACQFVMSPGGKVDLEELRKLHNPRTDRDARAQDAPNED